MQNFFFGGGGAWSRESNVEASLLKSNDFIQTETYPLVTIKGEQFSIRFFKNWTDHTKTYVLKY